MPKTVWNESFSVGVAELDAHHRHLADLINRLAEYRRSPSNTAVVDEILGALVAYAADHFQAEEALMAQCHFPDLAAHQAEHRQFSAAINELRYGARLGIVALDRLYAFLSGWWQHHIREEDMKYKPFLAAIEE